MRSEAYDFDGIDIDAMPIMEELAVISKILTHTVNLTQYGDAIAITAAAVETN